MTKDQLPPMPGPNMGAYAVALQRAIEHHVRGLMVPPEIAQKCPYHAKKLNDALATARAEDAVPDGMVLRVIDATAPREIYLNVSDEPEVAAEPWNDSWNNETMWCPDPALSVNVKYIRADLAARPVVDAPPADARQEPE